MPPAPLAITFSSLPGAEKASSAPGNHFSPLPGAEKVSRAPSNHFFLLPGAEKALRAPDGERIVKEGGGPGPLFAENGADGTLFHTEHPTNLRNPRLVIIVQGLG